MSDIIHIDLPDGSTLEVPKGTTALQIAKSISPRLAEAALAAKIAPLSPATEAQIEVAASGLPQTWKSCYD